MHSDEIIFTIFIIFSGAAILSTVALYARQTLLVAYIGLGLLMGPSALGVVQDHAFIQQVSDIGIMFLLFLLGLNLDPRKLLSLIKDTTLITVLASLILAGISYLIAITMGFSSSDSLIIAGSMIFSSTIIGLKLLPTTVLHHRHIGEVIISILLLQDLIAIVFMLLLHSKANGESEGLMSVLQVVLTLPLLAIFTFIFSNDVLNYLFRKFDRI